MFAKTFIDMPQSFWDNVLWTDETKVKLYWKCSLFIGDEIKPIRKRTLATVKHRGFIMLCGGFAASGTEGTKYVKGMMKSEDDQCIKEQNVLSNVRKLGLRQKSWVFQYDNDSMHISNSQIEWLKRKRWTIAMSPDLNFTGKSEICHSKQDSCKF